MVHNRQVMKCGTSIGGTLEPLTELAKRERFKRLREFCNSRPNIQLNDVPRMVLFCFSIHWEELNQYTAQGQSLNAFTDEFRPRREERPT